MIKDTILQNQSLDIKISDIAFEITHKLLLDPKYENPPTYLIEDTEDYNAVGNINCYNVFYLFNILYINTR